MSVIIEFLIILILLAIFLKIVFAQFPKIGNKDVKENKYESKPNKTN